ncbi:MAG TPA: hypothetical protein VLL98_04920 [Rickettsiales bacterium]|nr:hypothetical protein [Rickettsiales bacterium]
MNELMKNKLLEELCVSEKNRECSRKLEVNKIVNDDLVEPMKEIVFYYLKHRVKVRDDFIGLKGVINFVVKTGKCKYDGKRKFERLSGLIERIK